MLTLARAHAVASLLERMRELGEIARARANSKHDQRMLKKFYSEEGLRRRVLLQPG